MVAKLASGEVSPADLVWKEGMPDWIPASKVAELNLIGDGPIIDVPSNLDPTSPYATPSSNASVPATGAPIPTYLWQSIAVTLLCCIPFGVVAIVYASKVEGLAAKGDVPGAMSASANAKKWAIISLVCGLVLILLAVLAPLFAPGFAPGLAPEVTP